MQRAPPFPRPPVAHSYLALLLLVFVDVVELPGRAAELARVDHGPEAQRGERLEVAHLRRAQVYHHARFPISAERRLEKVSQLRVAERNVLRLAVDGREDAGEAREGLVDVLGLCQGLALRPASVHALRARQVAEVELQVSTAQPNLL